MNYLPENDLISQREFEFELGSTLPISPVSRRHFVCRGHFDVR